MSLNLHSIVNPLINGVVANQEIIICLPVTSQDSNFNIVSTYTQITTVAQIHLQNTQKLIHKDFYQHNRVYKKFYLNSTNLTGLNRNLGTNGDYIIWNSLYYKIVEVEYNFNTGWVKVIGAESTDFVSG
jgi:hypothetical protein